MTITRLAIALSCLLLTGFPATASARANLVAEPAAIAIGTVQGSDERSPLEGRQVTVEGVVTGNFVRGLGGFFLQDAGDGNPATSDALFVRQSPENATDITTGDHIRVHGNVIELEAGSRNGTLTTLEPERIEHLGKGRLAPVILHAPPANWEALEGMHVRIDAPLVISSSDQLARFGELTASFGKRLWQPTEVALPGSAAIAQVLADNTHRRIVLDDARNVRDPDHVWYLPDDIPPRAGSVATGVTGIVDQRHGQYRLQLTEPLQVQPATRPDNPQVEGNLRVAAFNLENLFNGDGHGSGFPTQRGAKTPEQLQAQLAKLVTALEALDADIVALMELENDGFDPHSSIAQLVNALNHDGSDWRFIHAGHGPGADSIRVGLIHRVSRVQAVGEPATLVEGPFGPRSRAPLAQAFRRGDGPTFVVVANHFKSKGCSEATDADTDQRDGQGCWNALRLDSAQRLHAWLETDPTGTGSDLQLILGDFNAYAMEDPVRWLRDAGWRDAMAVAGVPSPYGYIYNGLAGRLDHALLSPALATHLKGAAEWHINADEPDRFGYADDNVPGPWRSSDHDPLLLGFDL